MLPPHVWVSTSAVLLLSSLPTSTAHPRRLMTSPPCQPTALLASQAKKEGHHHPTRPQHTTPLSERYRGLFWLSCLLALATDSNYAMVGSFFAPFYLARGVSATAVGGVLGVSTGIGLSCAMRGAPEAIRRFSAARAMLYAALAYASCRILMATLALVHDPRRLALYTTLILAVQSFADATCDVAASTTVLLSVPREERTQAQGTFLALRSIGSLVAPPIGGWLFVKGGFALPFLSFGFMLFIACLPVLRVVLAASGDRASTQDEDGPDSFILQLPTVRRAFVTMTTLAACMSLPTSYWSPYLKSPPFLLDEARIGVITMIATVCFTISSIMAGSIEKLLGGKAMLSVGCCIAALGSFLIAPVYPFCLVPSTISVAAISMCVNFAGIGLVFAAASPLCVRLAEQAGFEEEKATVQTTSLWVLAFAIAGTAAPPIGGWLADRLGARWTNFICGSFALLATAPLLGPLGTEEQQRCSAEAGKVFLGKV